MALSQVQPRLTFDQLHQGHSARESDPLHIYSRQLIAIMNRKKQHNVYVEPEDEFGFELEHTESALRNSDLKLFKLDMENPQSQRGKQLKSMRKKYNHTLFAWMAFEFLLIIFTIWMHKNNNEPFNGLCYFSLFKKNHCACTNIYLYVFEIYVLANFLMLIGFFCLAVELDKKYSIRHFIKQNR